LTAPTALQNQNKKTCELLLVFSVQISLQNGQIRRYSPQIFNKGGLPDPHSGKFGSLLSKQQFSIDIFAD
jgi:hypothetical protein